MSNQNPTDERGNDLEITVCANGTVNVRNQVSGSGEVHTVMLADDGTALRCSCEGHKFNGHCYHQSEVESRPLIVASASAARESHQQVATDGGAAVESTETESDETPSNERTVDDYLDLGELHEQESERPDNCRCDDQLGEDMVCSPCIQQDFNTPNPEYDGITTDYWGQSIKTFDDGAVGAGEQRECQSCGSRFDVAMVAATEDSSNRNWEEFYECQQCGAEGSFRFFGETDTRRWVGRMNYPDEGGERL